ncbi:MAG: hypothetical protein COT80_01175 [Candidatus Buchananbacteria bacterium CG10_big_fil_rev_8_21_14_0_10_33_19]|uniref:Yip1 domain-containing protein n=1 Tax=Candidatus Buchananbacteria bacterium CG10_big_fil_rev_8_21_14_0_10_33_19 TaxID=1974525 RepID=A0A2H0W486_9BACT|nr:MAG: hypothetical protein COT80_01175 [Candidatus Buchananbacteria bacterium CG10_big_fil_rev_8_21_14_0_10_33_19]
MILYKIQDSILMSPAKRDKLVMTSLLFSVVINTFLWILLIFNFWQGSEYIVLSYNIYFGISGFGLWYQVLLMPAMGLLFIIFNFAIAFYVYLKEKIISYFLSFGALLVNIIIFLAALIIINVNI